MMEKFSLFTIEKMIDRGLADALQCLHENCLFHQFVETV